LQLAQAGLDAGEEFDPTFYYLLIAAGCEFEVNLAKGKAFYYLLIAAEHEPGGEQHQAEQPFYYLLIAARAGREAAQLGEAGSFLLSLDCS